VIGVTCFVVALAGLKISEQRSAMELTALPPMSGPGIRVRLLNPEGQPVQDCRANIWEPLANGSMKMGQEGQAQCQDGVISYPELEPGSYRLQAATKGLNLLDERILIREGESLDLGDIQLETAAILRGEVVFQGEVVPGARVRLDDNYFDDAADQKGTFRVPISEGEHTLTAGKDNMTGSAQVTIDLETENQVVIELQVMDEPGTLGLQLEPVPEGMKVTALHPKGPAASVLSVGEIIVSADGTSLVGQTLNSAAVHLGGAPESSVTLMNTEGEEKTLTRARRSALD
jgi:hypothetical protein